MTQQNIPNNNQSAVDGKGRLTTPFYRFLSSLQLSASGGVTPAQITAIEAQIAALQAEIDALPEGSYPTLDVTFPITTQGLLQNGYAKIGLAGTLVVTDDTTARTATLADRNTIIMATNTAGLAYTIPSGLDVDMLYLQQESAGQSSFVAGAGVTFDTNPPSSATLTQGSLIGAKKTAVDTWTFFGELDYTVPATSVLANPTNATATPVAMGASADGQTIVRRTGLLVFDALKAGEVTNTPAGGITATDVQTALDGLDTIKANIEQVQGGVLVFAVAGGTGDGITASLSPAPTLVDGMTFGVRASAANTSTTPTLALNGGTALTVAKFGDQALAAGDIYGAGHELIFRYVSAGPRFELLNPAASGSGGGGYTAGTGIDISGSNVISSTLGSIALSGSVATYADLPTGLGTGDAGKAYMVAADGLIYIWTGSAFPASGGGIALGGGALTLIGQYKITTAVSSVTFSSIPQTYTDLQLIASGRLTASGTVQVQCNSDTGSHYLGYFLYANGASVGSRSGTLATQAIFGNSFSYPGNLYAGHAIMDILNYTNTTFYKHMKSFTAGRYASTATQIGIFDTDWESTAAISSLLVSASAGNFAVGSVISLYGRQ